MQAYLKGYEQEFNSYLKQRVLNVTKATDHGLMHIQKKMPVRSKIQENEHVSIEKVAGNIKALIDFCRDQKHMIKKNDD